MPDPDSDIAGLEAFAIETVMRVVFDAGSDRPYRRGAAVAVVVSGKLAELMDALDIGEETQQRILDRARERYQSAVNKFYGTGQASQPATDRG